MGNRLKIIGVFSGLGLILGIGAVDADSENAEVAQLPGISGDVPSKSLIKSGVKENTRELVETRETMEASQGTKTQPEMRRSDEKISQTRGETDPKMGLEPHTVLIETGLMSALNELKGLRTEVKIGGETSSKDFIDHYKIFSDQIHKLISTVKTHQQHLSDGVNRYPDVAKSEDYKSTSAALDDLKIFAASWKNKVTGISYWKNQSQVMNDLEAIERRLKQALDKTRKFNSEQLDISNVG